METGTGPYQLYDDPFRFYAVMLNDIREARKEILLETYRFMHDSIGEKFREALVKKAAEGVKIKLLVDSWGTGASDAFFAPLIRHGAELRYFRKIKFFWDFFTKNHKRNHRKLLVIDEEVAWTGSANFAAYSLSWRELMLRVKGSLAPLLARTFHESYDIYKQYYFKKFAFKKVLHHRDYEIIRDLPSIYRQQIKRRYERLIRSAKRQVVIETPYFLPGHKLRREMQLACQRGVEVIVMIPQNSDVRIVDILRNRYLGLLHRYGVKFMFYQPNNLHAKALLIDNRTFVIGSSNFDYRSFRYMYEMVVLGRYPEIVRQLSEHIDLTLRDSKAFSYEAWKSRPWLEKVFERLLIPFRYLL